MRIGSLIITTIMLTMAAFAAPLHAEWVYDGTPVCTAPGLQQYPWIVEDGGGGAFMAWEDGRSAFLGIYAQRIDANGIVLWASNGIPISTGGSGNKQRPKLVRDGSGGCIMAWYDMRGGVDYDVYVQRLSGSGTVLWTANGLAICTATGDQLRAEIISDGAGGAIVTWYDRRDGTWNIYAQRIGSDGTALWTGDGVAVCDASGDQEWGRIAADGAGGAVIAWHDSRGGNYDIYAQRLDAGGNPLWGAGGVRLCGAEGTQTCRDIVPDGAGGAIAIWEDSRRGNIDIYARLVDAGGTPLWTDDGVALCTAAGDQDWPYACSNGAGGAIVVWRDLRDPILMYDAFMQKIDNDGVVAWNSDGIALASAACDQQNTHPIPDGLGGAKIAWRDSRMYPCETSDVYAQRVDADGEPYLYQGGIPIGAAGYTQTLGHLVDDGQGGAIVVWYDNRALNYDVYAYRIDFGAPVPDLSPVIRSVQDVPHDQGGWLSVQWDRSGVDVLSDMKIDHYSLWRRLALGMTPLAVSPGPDSLTGLQMEGTGRCFVGAEVPPDYEGAAYQIDKADPNYAWEWIGNVPAMGFETYALTVRSLYDSTAYSTRWQYFMAVAHTTVAGLFYESAVDSGYSVDNLPPLAPEGLTARQVAPPDCLLLSWDRNEELDIHHYRIYRGEDGGFVPEPGNLLGETGETSFHDWEWSPGSRFCYRLTACDAHGNESESALVIADQVIATLLQSFSAAVGNDEVVISWRLASINEGTSFRVLRSGDGGGYLELAGEWIVCDGLAFEYVDGEVEPGSTYRYRMEIVEPAGSWILFETDTVSIPRIPLTLKQNYPNPFNPATSITFGLPAAGRVLLEVFDVSGRLVVVLADKVMSKGNHSITWDGRGESGSTLSSGVYFCRIGFEKDTITRKMVLLR